MLGVRDIFLEQMGRNEFMLLNSVALDFDLLGKRGVLLSHLFFVEASITGSWLIRNVDWLAAGWDSSS
jgi:hypothetical protein